MRATILTLILSALTGCAAHENSVPSNRSMAASARWIATLSPQQVSALSPEEAKAILLARAAIEQRAQDVGSPQPQVLEYRVNLTSDGWTVHVQYVGLWFEGKPHPAPGYFSTVYIDRNWAVRNVVGGA